MPGAIFISYRRADSAAFAGRIADFFSYKYPDIRVFFDVAAIEPGADFVATIRSRLQSSEVVLSIIGDAWINTADQSGRRRLDDPNDFVRLELSMALSLGARVIPVLLDNAQMPSPDLLPQDLKPLVRLNAEFIRGNAFQRDTQHLADFLREYLLNSKKTVTAPPRAPARHVDSAVKLAIVSAFTEFRDGTEQYIILENDSGKFVQFYRDPPDEIVIDLPHQAFSVEQIGTAQRLLAENFRTNLHAIGEGDWEATLPLEPSFLSHITLDVFEYVYQALPEKPLTVSIFS